MALPGLKRSLSDCFGLGSAKLAGSFGRACLHPVGADGCLERTHRCSIAGAYSVTRRILARALGHGELAELVAVLLERRGIDPHGGPKTSLNCVWPPEVYW